MPPRWSVDQVLKLAPDEATAKNGRGLTGKFSETGSDGELCWGLCRGSGSKPYRVVIDLAGPAFKCSCPSRKFPCKHSVGLLLVYTERQGDVGGGRPPDWAREWQEKRRQKAERREQPPERDPVKDAKAAAKRLAAREQSADAGVGELRLWLLDLARQGLAWAQTQEDAFWDRMARRLVDHQVGGLVTAVRELASHVQAGESGRERAAADLARLWLAVEAWRRRDALPEDLQATLRSELGFAVDQREVLANAPVEAGTWHVCGQVVTEAEKLRAQRSWLVRRDGRRALVLSFAAGMAMLDASLVPGMAIEAEVAYFPGVRPQRALVKTQRAVDAAGPPPGGPVAAELAAAGAAAAADPWIVRQVLVCADVVPVMTDGHLALIDAADDALPVDPAWPDGWQLLAVVGTTPATVAVEWDGHLARPLSVWTGSGVQTW